VVGTRNTAQDGQTTVVDFDGAQLVLAQLSALHLSRANFSKADLGTTNLTGADLFGANLTEAKWPKNLPAPSGWVRDPGSDRLSPANPGLP
jgi:uncharacterized protein YjbI with pentapeptide repeats